MNEEIVVTARIYKDDLSLIIAGNAIQGWEDIAVTLRAEAFPNSFQVKGSVTTGGQVPAKAGDRCVVKLGNDVVITGWVDRVVETIDEASHTVTIAGRGLTQDLVDCSAEWPSHQLINGNAFTIAQRLCMPYGLTVLLANNASGGPNVAAWALNYGETAADIIQRLARSVGILAYEDAQGRVVLADVGAARAASGATYGDNAQTWSSEKTMDQRYSDYVCCISSNSAFFNGQAGVGGDQYFDATDPNVTRHRLKYLITESVATDPQEFTKTKALWEASRRLGRSFVIKATVDSWRDSARTLWTPNTIIPLSGPGVEAAMTYILSEVTFRKSGDGTVADLMAMPSSAFTAEPIVLQPINTTGQVPGQPQAQ